MLPPAVTMNTINISRTAGNAIMAKFCCACGSDISKRVSDRRPLGTAKSSGVLQVWRKMLKKFGREELEQKVLNETGSLLMCRKCFSAYDRYYRLEVEIENTLLNTLHEESEGDVTSHTACLVSPSTSKALEDLFYNIEFAILEHNCFISC